MASIINSFLAGTGISIVVFLAAIPWLFLADPQAVKKQLRRPAAWGIALAVLAAAGLGLAVFTNVVLDANTLIGWGRLLGALLHFQLILAVFVGIFALLLPLWPQGAAVALAAFREGVRQPTFWIIGGAAFAMIAISPFLPYFTFGEDYKMVREIGNDFIMLAGILFAVLVASISISEEIEGRTAITVMSKPVSRRHFLIGKFIGTFLAAALMIGLLGWFFNGVTWFKLWFDRETAASATWMETARDMLNSRLPDPILNLVLGMITWFDNAFTSLPGLVFGACQVMVLLSIAVALATRLPMVVNLVVCLVVFFLGHLTHILVLVSQGKLALIVFMARLFDTILPGLEYFDFSSLIVRDIPPEPGQYFFYVISVVSYAVIYSTIALLFGLILFEDRDLA